MAYTQNNTNLSSLLFSFMNQPDPMLSMLEWLCEQSKDFSQQHDRKAESGDTPKNKCDRDLPE
jgi:hypothetical protein